MLSPGTGPAAPVSGPVTVPAPSGEVAAEAGDVLTQARPAQHRRLPSKKEGKDGTNDRKAVRIDGREEAGRPPSARPAARRPQLASSRADDRPGGRTPQREACVRFATSPRPTELIFNSACQQDAPRMLALPS